jgi:hypothetical protein
MLNERVRNAPTPTGVAERQLPIRARSASEWAERAARYGSGLKAQYLQRPAQSVFGPPRTALSLVRGCSPIERSQQSHAVPCPAN